MPAKKPRKPLDRARVADVAAELIDRDGLAEFSMRRLAKELEVEPMSLYYWFPSKDHVMDALLDRFAARIGPPPDGSWDAQIAATSRAFREAARVNPATFPFFAMHRFNTETALQRLEWVLSALARVHPDPATRASAFRLWVHWILGFCLDETNGYAKGPSAQEPPPDEVVARQFPRVSELAPYNRPEHFDALFEAGLAAVIAGIEGIGAGVPTRAS